MKTGIKGVSIRERDSAGIILRESINKNKLKYVQYIIIRLIEIEGDPGEKGDIMVWGWINIYRER